MLGSGPIAATPVASMSQAIGLLPEGGEPVFMHVKGAPATSVLGGQFRIAVGCKIRIKVAIGTSDGSAVDPGVLLFKFRDPLGHVTTYRYGINESLVKDSVGNYHVDVTLSAPGRWVFHWQSAAPAASNEASIVVSTPAI